ncbi:MAG: class A beta-lactamase-related serine hydrolase [Alphaproteobacteria bacterium]|nr:MAG: class A beta-lactamase-related serine hydrolase [Alphaproteobacteria bacterium]
MPLLPPRFDYDMKKQGRWRCSRRPRTTGNKMTKRNFSKLDQLLENYVASNRLSGVLSVITDRGSILHKNITGLQDQETGMPMAWDSIFRIYSMTKPITSIAVMMEWEKKKFDLDDPVSDYLPSFKNSSVLEPNGTIRPAKRQMSVRDLLTHTSGITLPAFAENHLAPLYLEQNLDGMRSKGNLADIIDRLGSMPLLFDPGSIWAYSMATDVLGRLVEIWSGLSFEDYLKANIFTPLGMTETAFEVPEKDKARITTNYSIEDGKLGPVLDKGATSRYLSPPEFISGSGGLASTAEDYLQFMRMLLKGGEHNSHRIIQKETLGLMTRNHLDGDMEDMGANEFGETPWYGIGFGLGFSVVMEPGKSGLPSIAHDWGWSGAAGTTFFINPELDMAAMLLTQYMPSNSYPLRKEYREAVYSAFAD